jgi:hypothetical protein
MFARFRYRGCFAFPLGVFPHLWLPLTHSLNSSMLTAGFPLGESYCTLRAIAAVPVERCSAISQLCSDIACKPLREQWQDSCKNLNSISIQRAGNGRQTAHGGARWHRATARMRHKVQSMNSVTPPFTRGPITIAEWNWTTVSSAVQSRAFGQSSDFGQPQQAHSRSNDQKYLSMSQLADRWQCSRGTVYNRLRAEGASVLNFAPRGKRGRKVVSLEVVLHIEAKNTKRIW